MQHNLTRSYKYTVIDLQRKKLTRRNLTYVCVYMCVCVRLCMRVRVYVSACARMGERKICIVQIVDIALRYVCKNDKKMFIRI